MSKLVIHATTLSLPVAGRWRGVLIMGPSGIGKSDLALRALQAGCRLISDDYSCLWSSGGHLYAGAPDTISGQMEIRGLGIIGVTPRALTRIHLAAQAQDETPERLPEAETTEFIGHRVATLRVRPREASSLDKLLTALRGRV
jgi:serine kinase of HPr protein (carbohydrate metabolism regulator)